MAADKKTMEVSPEEELLKPMPELALPADGTVSYPDAAAALSAQKEFFRSRLDIISGLEMTEANLERVRAIKKGIVGWRTSFDKQADEYIRVTYKAPMDVFKAVIKEVESEIKTMEDEVDGILSKEEAKRVAAVDVIIDGLVADMEDEYGVTVPDLVRNKKWYNKTADMNAVAEEIRSVFKDARDAKERHEADIRLIERLCDDDRLDRGVYLSLLEHESASVVAEKINVAKERLAEQDKAAEEKVQAQPAREEPRMVIGEVVDASKLRTDFPGLDVKMVLEIEYPTDIRDELTRVFSELRKHGVKMHVISKTEPEIPVF